MKRNIIIGLFLMVFLTVFMTAQIIDTKELDVEFTIAQKNKLSDYGIVSPETTPLDCIYLTPNLTKCKFEMYQVLDNGEKYGLGGHYIEKRNRTDSEIIKLQEDYIKDWLKNYTVILEDRETRTLERLNPKININIKEEK